MVLVTIKIDLYFFFFLETPFAIDSEFVIIESRFEFEIDNPILFDSIEFHFLFFFPIIPATSDTNLLRSRDFFSLINEIYLFSFKPLGVDEDCFEILFNFPIFAPILSFFSDFLAVFFLDIIVIFFESSDFLFNSKPIHKDFVLESVELSVPSFGNIFFFNDTIKSIFPNFLIGSFIMITLDSSSNASFKIFKII